MRINLETIRRSGWLLSLDMVAAERAAVSEWASTASAGWAFGTYAGGLSVWAGIALGGGAIFQGVADAEDRATAAAFGAPLLGLSTQLAPRLGIFSELQLRFVGYVEDARPSLRLGPLGAVGVSWKL